MRRQSHLIVLLLTWPTTSTCTSVKDSEPKDNDIIQEISVSPPVAARVPQGPLPSPTPAGPMPTFTSIADAEDHFLQASARDAQFVVIGHAAARTLTRAYWSGLGAPTSMYQVSILIEEGLKGPLASGEILAYAPISPEMPIGDSRSFFLVSPNVQGNNEILQVVPYVDQTAEHTRALIFAALEPNK